MRPESDKARQFAQLVDSFVAGGSKDPVVASKIRATLNQWRDNDAQLQPALQRSALLKELAPISQNLSALSVAGLQALDYLGNGTIAPDAWVASQSTLLEESKKPHGAAAPVDEMTELSQGAFIALEMLESTNRFEF